MKRWDKKNMLEIGHKLFEKIYKRKYLAHHNHEIRFLAREIEKWLPKGIQSLIDGTYTPRHLERVYFQDGIVDQLYLSDRIFQHILLKQIKPTFSYVMNPNCYHVLAGPTGVKLATERIRQVLQEEKPNFLIRADIKGFYSSIVHYKLINDIKKYYDDPKLIAILERIIKNPIETCRGYKNPDTGVALRGPLSQFFSGLYLKSLDEACAKMNVSYLRYQDDILILCKSKRQLNRCKRRLMEVLYERGLKLSRKKTRIGSVKSGFHFLGINYPGTQLLDNTATTCSFDSSTIKEKMIDGDFFSEDESKSNIGSENHENIPISIVPHARTLRKAREQVKWMVFDGASPQSIRNYLHRWALWWVKTADWQYTDLWNRLIESCWKKYPAADFAAGLLMKYLTGKFKDEQMSPYLPLNQIRPTALALLIPL